MLIIDKIKKYDRFPDSEQKIADFLISLGEGMEGKSTRWIAEKTFSSPATVIRLCKRLGFSGFDQFKAQYLKELQYIDKQYGKINVNFPFEKSDSMMSISNKIGSLYHDTVDDTLSLLSHDDTARSKRMICEADAIYLYSFGTALNQAESFKEKMMKIGKRVFLSANLNYQLYEASCMKENDLAIIISYSGETENALKIADICKRNQVSILSITSMGENSLSAQSDAILYISSKENLFNNIADYSIHVSVNLILDIMYSLVFQENFDNNYQHKQHYTKLLENKRKSSNSILMENEETL